MAYLKPQFYLKPVSNQSLVELSTLRFPPKSVVTDTLLTDFLHNDWSDEARKFISDSLSANKTQLELSQLPSSEINFSVLNDSDSRSIDWINFCQMLDKALEYDKSELAKLTKEVDHMIISGYAPVSESLQIKENKKLKRIARYKEFDNGHVLHNWEKMTSAKAEDLAKQMSIKDPNDI